MVCAEASDTIIVTTNSVNCLVFISPFKLLVISDLLGAKLIKLPKNAKFSLFYLFVSKIVCIFVAE